MTTLTHNQQIKMNKPAFRYNTVVTVGTVEGYGAEYGKSREEAVSKALENMKKFPGMGHTLAWTNKAASVITDNYAGKEADRAKAAAAYNSATVLEENE